MTFAFWTRLHVPLHFAKLPYKEDIKMSNHVQLVLVKSVHL